MKQKNIKQIVMVYFFDNPSSKLRVREIERALKLPLPSVIRYCRELEEEDILAISRIGNVNFYTASRSEAYLLEKKLYNIKQIYKSGLIEFLKINLSNPPIILFGSYAKGEDIENSDIDIYIETPSRKKLDLVKFEKLLNREIQIFQHASIREITNKNLANNIINGIMLNNQIEVFI